MKATDKQIIEALKKSGGVIAFAATALGMTREVLSRRVNSSTKLKEARTDATESMVDFAEMALFEKLRQGDIRAILFTLEGKGRKRGYGKLPPVVEESTEPRNDEDIYAEMRAALGLPPTLSENLEIRGRELLEGDGINSALGLPPE